MIELEKSELDMIRTQCRNDMASIGEFVVSAPGVRR